MLEEAQSERRRNHIKGMMMAMLMEEPLDPERAFAGHVGTAGEEGSSGAYN